MEYTKCIKCGNWLGGIEMLGMNADSPGRRCNACIDRSIAAHKAADTRKANRERKDAANARRREARASRKDTSNA